MYGFSALLLEIWGAPCFVLITIVIAPTICVSGPASFCQVEIQLFRCHTDCFPPARWPYRETAGEIHRPNCRGLLYFLFLSPNNINLMKSASALIQLIKQFSCGSNGLGASGIKSVSVMTNPMRTTLKKSSSLLHNHRFMRRACCWPLGAWRHGDRVQSRVTTRLPLKFPRNLPNFPFSPHAQLFVNFFNNWLPSRERKVMRSLNWN